MCINIDSIYWVTVFSTGRGQRLTNRVGITNLIDSKLKQQIRGDSPPNRTWSHFFGSEVWPINYLLLLFRTCQKHLLYSGSESIAWSKNNIVINIPSKIQFYSTTSWFISTIIRRLLVDKLRFYLKTCYAIVPNFWFWITW